MRYRIKDERTNKISFRSPPPPPPPEQEKKRNRKVKLLLLSILDNFVLIINFYYR